MGQYDKAVVDFTRAIETGSKGIPGWAARAMVYERLQQWDKALADWDTALAPWDKVDKDFQPPAWLHSRAGVHAVLGHWEQADTDLTRAIMLQPTHNLAPDAQWWLELACFRAQTGNVENCRKHNREMLEKFGATKDPHVAWRIALSCLLAPAEGENLMARGLAEMARPRSWRAGVCMTRGLAKLYRRSGQHKQAVQQLQVVLKSWANNPGGGNESSAPGSSWPWPTTVPWPNRRSTPMAHAPVASWTWRRPRKKYGIFRSQGHVWAMCLSLRREAEGLMKK